MKNGNALAGQQHNDIIFTDPVDDQERIKLVQELKRRGNAGKINFYGITFVAFKIGSMREADALYSRAIVICNDNEMKSTIFSNRSMVFAKMGMFTKAKEDAESFLKLKTCAKAYYRLAVAERGLKFFISSIEAFEASVKLEPTNKSVLKELKNTKISFEAHKKESKKKKAEEEEQAKVKNIVVSKKIVKNSENGVTKCTKKKDDDLSMRGYRTLSDGRKTTYFNMERTEEELKLIGENKPTKLVDVTEGAEEVVDEGASAWNVKGTFEEKDFSDWAKEKIQENVSKIKYSVEKTVGSSTGIVSFCPSKEFKDLEGNASKTFTRKKFRRIFDFNFKIPIAVKCIDKNSRKQLFKLDMELLYAEFSGDVVANDEELDCELIWTNRQKAKTFENVILQEVKNSGSGLQKHIRTALLEWVSEFNSL